jgi:ArsR family transcriptional regulator
MVRRQKQKIYSKQADIVKAIAHPIRIAIIDFLKDGPKCVCDIATSIGAERSNVSRHLSLMVSVGVLEYYKDGLKVIYSLKTKCVLEFLACVTKCLKEQARENQQLLKAL